MRLLCLLACSFASIAAELTPLEIVQRAIDREAANQTLRKQYTYRETLRQRVAKNDEHKVHEVFFIAGKEYRKLVEKDGAPLSEKRAADEQSRLDKELAKARNERPEEAQKRAAKELREHQEFRSQVTQAFEFRLVGEEEVSGRQCYRVHAEPKPGFKAKGDARVLAKLKGDLWIDKTGFHWAKADLETIDSISGMGGIFRLAKGSTIGTRRTFVNNEVWFPEHIDVKATAKALLFVSAAIDMKMRFSDWRKFSVDSKVLFADE